MFFSLKDSVSIFEEMRDNQVCPLMNDMPFHVKLNIKLMRMLSSVLGLVPEGRGSSSERSLNRNTYVRTGSIKASNLEAEKLRAEEDDKEQIKEGRKSAGKKVMVYFC